MMDKLKKTAVLLGGVMLTLLIIVWGIKHNMKPVDIQQETEPETEAVTGKTEELPEPPSDYDIAAGLKLKEKDGIKTLKTDHFILTLTHGDSWDAKVNSRNSITFYNIAGREAGCGGRLFSLIAYEPNDKDYENLPSYSVVGEKDGKAYVAEYPSDVQADVESEENMQLYMDTYDEVNKIRDDGEDSPLVLK